MKFTKTAVVSAVAAILIIGGTAIALGFDSQNAAQQTKSTSISKPVEATTRHRVDITYTAKAGVTSLDQLKTEADKVITKQSQYGEYVDSIEGSAGGTDGKYWSFYVDGTMSEVGAGTYIQKGGEQIEWKFQKL